MSEQSKTGVDQALNQGNEFCFNCEKTTKQVLLQFEPSPNDAQLDADDIPTDELQIVAGNLCCECGRVITTTPAEATRSLNSENDGGQADE